MARQDLLVHVIMQIFKDKKLKELQREFSEVFPYLKIEFYSKEHQKGESSAEDFLLDPELTVGEVSKIKEPVSFTFWSSMRTGDFENSFKEQFDLNVQVFRKSYGEWLQTWATDNWPLREQNRRASIMGEK